MSWHRHYHGGPQAAIISSARVQLHRTRHRRPTKPNAYCAVVIPCLPEGRAKRWLSCTLRRGTRATAKGAAEAPGSSESDDPDGKAAPKAEAGLERSWRRLRVSAVWVGELACDAPDEPRDCPTSTSGKIRAPSSAWSSKTIPHMTSPTMARTAFPSQLLNTLDNHPTVSRPLSDRLIMRYL